MAAAANDNFDVLMNKNTILSDGIIKYSIAQDSMASVSTSNKWQVAKTGIGCNRLSYGAGRTSTPDERMDYFRSGITPLLFTPNTFTSCLSSRFINHH
jgi:hypothetical protein